MKVLEAIRILHGAVVEQDKRLDDLSETIRGNNDLQRQLIQALVGAPDA